MDFCAETLGSLSSTSQKILRFINNVSIIDAHQAQFSKNRNLLKAKYLHLINPVLSSEELKRHLSNLYKNLEFSISNLLLFSAKMNPRKKKTTEAKKHQIFMFFLDCLQFMRQCVGNLIYFL